MPRTLLSYASGEKITEESYFSHECVIFDSQISEPSCIIDLRRVPHGVGRAGLQALIFPVSICSLKSIRRSG